MNTTVIKNKQRTAGDEDPGANVYFPRGLPGLEKHNSYRLQILRDNPFFYLLRSVYDPEVGFILVDPFVFFPGYRVVVSEHDLQELQAPEVEELLALTTVTVAGREKLTSNLAAPLLLNLPRGLGKQIIITERMSEIRRPLPLHGVQPQRSEQQEKE